MPLIVEKNRYYDRDGNFLWETPMIMSRIHAVGDWFIEDSKGYTVLRVAVADKIEYVNVVEGLPLEIEALRGSTSTANKEVK